MTFDNLGGNVTWGFAKSLSAMYFCRMCLCSKNETKQLTTAQPTRYRNKLNYAKALDIVKNSQKIDLKTTKGISEYCILNDLKYFHILDHWTADIMHDLCEGSVITLLDEFFHLGMAQKVFSQNDVKNLVSFYDYGVLSGHFLPSDVKKDRCNLNQSASQTKNLIHHIPFVFNSYKNKDVLRMSWICINSMLKIIRTCYSNTITEEDLIELDKNVECYLNNFLKCFNKHLKPKDHFLTHYSEIIRRSGPLVHMSTMRFEMKHKELTYPMKNTNNFKNVTKSIAEKYESKNTFRDVYTDKIEHAKFREVTESFMKSFEHLLGNIQYQKVRIMKNLHFNSDRYGKEMILKHSTDYFEIDYILSINGEYAFICSKYDRILFDDFLMSVQIKKSFPEDQRLIKHSELTYSKTHDKKILGENIFILSDSLEIK